jgi:2-polyprenyl-3-methyl-5-hydroxy-6-metoxy-1,4-benzoquinol methylase
MTACPACGSQAARQFTLGDDRALYACRGCGLVHRGAAWTPADSVEHYEDYYAGRDVVFDPLTEKRYHQILGGIERRVGPGRLLDVGCGLGHFLTVAEARGWQPAGLEVSASGIGHLERLKADRQLGFALIDKPLLDADLPASSFRAITMFEVLEHLSDPRTHLERIHALLEPGGVLYLTTPNFDSFSRLALGSRWRGLTTDHLCLFNPRSLRMSLGAAGFDVLTLRTRNVDIPEILKKWRRRASGPGGVETFTATQACRHQLERSPWLRAAKAVVNVGLDWLGRGDTLEAVAVKPV